MTGWEPIDTLPLDRTVWVRTVRGLACMARSRNRETRWVRRADGWGPRRVNCVRMDHVVSGDVVAVAWREPLRDDVEYNATMRRIGELFFAEKNTEEGLELDQLADLVVEYEGSL